jgi:hypothetical protein
VIHRKGYVDYGYSPYWFTIDSSNYPLVVLMVSPDGISNVGVYKVEVTVNLINFPAVSKVWILDVTITDSDSVSSG